MAMTREKTKESSEPPITDSNPARLSFWVPIPAPTPTLSTSAAATPSGYGSGESTTIARRRGTVYITPRIPPTAQIPNEVQNGNPVHQPTMTRPGSTNMMDESVPAADATVWTMLFSSMVEFLKNRRTAIETTAGGMDKAKEGP